MDNTIILEKISNLIDKYVNEDKQIKKVEILMEPMKPGDKIEWSVLLRNSGLRTIVFTSVINTLKDRKQCDYFEERYADKRLNRRFVVKL